MLVLVLAVLQAAFAERVGDIHKAGLASRSGGVLATDRSAAMEAAVATKSMVAGTSVASLQQAVTTKSHMIPGEGGRAMMKMMAGCVCLLVLYKLVMSIDCYSKRLDCRRCRMIGRFLLWAGWDEFPTQRVTVTVHSVADIQNRGMMGGEKMFKVKVAFRWSQFMTSSTGDMRWDQTKGIDIPQGADECVITLYSEGKIKDTTIGEYVLETKRDMLDAKKFWGEKKKLKLENKGKLVGTILITFRNQEDDGSGLGELPIDGVEEDSALAISVRDAYEAMIKDGTIQKPPAKPQPAPQPAAEGQEGEPPAPEAPEPEVVKLEGHKKVDLLSRCLTGPLREVGADQKEGEKTFIRVICCNFAELQGEDMREETARQWKKAHEKGLTELPQKWYWVWYEDKKSAFHAQKWHEPDGFIPMTAISKINRQPDRNDQFVISYTEEHDKKTLIYRRDGGKSLDVWIDGLDLCFTECRYLTKEEKEGAKKGLAP